MYQPQQPSLEKVYLLYSTHFNIVVIMFLKSKILISLMPILLATNLDNVEEFISKKVSFSTPFNVSSEEKNSHIIQDKKVNEITSNQNPILNSFKEKWNDNIDHERIKEIHQVINELCSQASPGDPYAICPLEICELIEVSMTMLIRSIISMKKSLEN